MDQPDSVIYLRHRHYRDIIELDLLRAIHARLLRAAVHHRGGSVESDYEVSRRRSIIFGDGRHRASRAERPQLSYKHFDAHLSNFELYSDRCSDDRN